MNYIKTLISFFLILTLLGCGQTGPLYLPDSEPPIHVEPESKPEAEANEE